MLFDFIKQNLDISSFNYGNINANVKLIEGLKPDIASKILALRINGLDLEAYPQRIYPQDDLVSNLVGFLDYDRVPQAGLELSFDEELSFREKSRSYRFGRDGTPLPNDIELSLAKLVPITTLLIKM